MKIIYSPLSPDYSSYTFPYAVYAQYEHGDDIAGIYRQGFLPYSADPNSTKISFYLARSVRIDLACFDDSSENKRVARKMPLTPNISLIPKDDFDTKCPNFKNLCLNYIEKRFSKNAMSPQRLDYVLNHKLSTHFVDFKDQKDIRIGSVVCSLHENMMHYWFAFYDTKYLTDFPLGKWMMWRCIHLAKDLKLNHIYLGTCYGKNSLYKVRDFKGIEFFDGVGWSNDKKHLKNLCKLDHEKTQTIDQFKREGKL